MVNLSSPFVRTVIQTFDQQKIYQNIFSNESSNFKKENEPPHEFGEMPCNVQALCAEFSGDMASWFSIVSFLDSSHILPACKKRLEVLNIKPTETPSYKDQLLQYIFDRVLWWSIDPRLEMIIDLSYHHYPITTKIHFFFLRLCERVCFVAKTILNHKPSQVVLSLLTGLVFGLVFTPLLFSKLITALPQSTAIRLRNYLRHNPKVLEMIVTYSFLLSVHFIDRIASRLLEQIGNASTSIHSFTKKTITNKKIQTAKALWMQLV